MLEILGVPSGMTGGAFFIDPRNLPSGRMTGAAIEAGMILVKAPSGAGMRECRALFGVVTFGAAVLQMAAVAHGVNLFLTFRHGACFLQVVTVAAILLLMAINTAEPEKVDMFFVIKSHHRGFLKGGMISLLHRFGDNRMRDTHNIGGIKSGAGQGFPFGGGMADDTFGIVAPFAMTTETLAMIGPFEAGLAEIGGISLSPVTVFAGLNFITGAVMMTGAAVATHLGHSGMKFMIEFDRLVKVRQFIKQHRFRRFREAVLADSVGHRKSRAGAKTVILHRRLGAGVADLTIHF